LSLYHSVSKNLGRWRHSASLNSPSFVKFRLAAGSIVKTEQKYLITFYIILDQRLRESINYIYTKCPLPLSYAEVTYLINNVNAISAHFHIHATEHIFGLTWNTTTLLVLSGSQTTRAITALETISTPLLVLWVEPSQWRNVFYLLPQFVMYNKQPWFGLCLAGMVLHSHSDSVKC